MYSPNFVYKHLLRPSFSKACYLCWTSSYLPYRRSFLSHLARFESVFICPAFNLFIDLWSIWSATLSCSYSSKSTVPYSLVFDFSNPVMLHFSTDSVYLPDLCLKQHLLELRLLTSVHLLHCRWLCPRTPTVRFRLKFVTYSRLSCLVASSTLCCTENGFYGAKPPCLASLFREV